MNEDLERIDVAIKALWKLYRSARWGPLTVLGLDKATYDPLFREFDALYITSDHGLIRREEQVFSLISFIGPRLVEVAVFMLRMHWVLDAIKNGHRKAAGPL